MKLDPKKKCREFNGLQNSTCDSGVLYVSVRTEVVEDGSKRYKYPCIGQVDEGCAFYDPYSEQELKEKEQESERIMDCIKAGVSWCCGAEIDESQVITEGSHKNHGPRFCSKCGKLQYMV